MAYSADSFVADEQPTTAKWNKLWTNDASFNDGSGIADNAIIARHLSSSIITSAEIDWASATGKIWWEELGRHTLVGAADLLTVAGFTARKYLRFIFFGIATGGTLDFAITFNSDGGANYSRQATINNGAPGDAVSQTSLAITGGASAENKYGIIDIINIAAQEKIGRSTVIESGGAGAGNAPDCSDQDIKWANTAAQISTIAISNGGTGDFAAGSELVVLGHD